MRVLVADDDPGSRLVAQAILEELGHDCVVAPDGEAAWVAFQERRPDVLVTDWMMPGTDGLELCRRIRGATGDGYTYIIVVTSLIERGEVVRGMEAGADDYLTKPLDPFALETRLLAARRVTALHLQLGRHRHELAELARIDPLTNLGNRRCMGEDIALLHARSRRYGRRYSLALFDVDHFKAYNDTYGHPAGDEALRAVAATLAAQVRQTDGVYRYGGEEFLMVLPEQAPPGAVVAIDRARRAVEELGIRHAGGLAGVLTVSAGLAAFLPGRRVTGEEVMSEADTALYRAKTGGRNAVVPAAAARP